MSARDTYLRASAYYASSLYFDAAAEIVDRLVPTWERHRKCFDEAVALFTPKVEHVEILTRARRCRATSSRWTIQVSADRC